MYTQFQFNKLAFNPAYAGSREVMSFTALYRHQWAGIEGAPSTISFNLHTPLRDKDYAVGFQVINDRSGVTHTTSVYGDYAYRMPIGNGRLSMGVHAGATFHRVGLTAINFFDPADPAVQGDLARWLPNVGLGLYYKTDMFFAGLSVPQLIQNTLSPDHLTGVSAKQSRHYYAMVGQVINLGESGNFKLRPSALLKYVESGPVQADLNLSLLMMERFWLGSSYRTDETIAFNMEVNISGQLRLGYAYDLPMGILGEYTSGTHEILLGFDLDFSGNSAISPRRLRSPSYF